MGQKTARHPTFGLQAGKKRRPPLRWRLLGCVTDAAEALPASLSALAMTAYVQHVESEHGPDASPDDGNTQGYNHMLPHFLDPPSPELMLASCLVLGTAASSFVYRRQGKDPGQSVTLAVVAAGSVALGWALGASMNLIILAYLPWSACVAMVLSAVIFEWTCWLKPRRRRPMAADREGVRAWEEKKQNGTELG